MKVSQGRRTHDEGALVFFSPLHERTQQRLDDVQIENIKDNTKIPKSTSYHLSDQQFFLPSSSSHVKRVQGCDEENQIHSRCELY